MSITIQAKSLTRLCSHLRNISKAAEVLGCTKSRKVTQSASVAIEYPSDHKTLVCRGSDGSEVCLPLGGLDDVPRAVMLAFVGLEDSAAINLVPPAGAASLSIAAKEAHRAMEEARAERDALAVKLAQANDARVEVNRTLSAVMDERDQLLMTVEELTAQLNKATRAAPVAVAPIKERLDAAKAEHGSLLDAIVAETEAPRVAVNASPVAVATRAASAVVAAVAVEALTMLEGRSDVEIESVRDRVVRVTFVPKPGAARGVQGVGIADALKARGFSYSAKLSVDGRLVWVR